MSNFMPKIVGNEKLKNHICQNILEGTLPHASIIEGPAGTGKHTIAFMAAAALACDDKERKSGAIPCSVCDNCFKILGRKSPDVILVGSEGKASIGVEAIRFLREDVHVIPNDIDYKIYIIEDADKMTPQAQNALLLTLEEPPSYVRFFLLCESANALLETIRSRAPVFRTEPISEEDIDRYLTENDTRAAQMKLTSPAEYARLIKAGKCGIGKALEYLEPKAFAPVLENIKVAEKLLEQAIKKSSKQEVFPLMMKLSNSKRDTLKLQLALTSDAIRDLILLKESDTAPLCFYSDRDEAIDLCDRASLATLFAISEAVSASIEENSRNANVKLMITKLFSEIKLI